MWQQKEFKLVAKSRGFHLIINENADPTVRHDFEKHMNVLVPEGAAHFLHTFEGLDDMPAHIKASMLGTNLTVPMSQGAIQLGVWQGIYLGEHRNNATNRTIVARLNGQLGVDR